MVRAWYMDDEPTDQRLEHHRNPPEFLTLEELHKITGVEYFKVLFRFFFFNSQQSIYLSDYS